MTFILLFIDAMATQNYNEYMNNIRSIYRQDPEYRQEQADISKVSNTHVLIIQRVYNYSFTIL